MADTSVPISLPLSESLVGTQSEYTISPSCKYRISIIIMNKTLEDNYKHSVT